MAHGQKAVSLSRLFLAVYTDSFAPTSLSLTSLLS